MVRVPLILRLFILQGALLHHSPSAVRLLLNGSVRGADLLGWRIHGEEDTGSALFAILLFSATCPVAGSHESHPTESNEDATLCLNDLRTGIKESILWHSWFQYHHDVGRGDFGSSLPSTVRKAHDEMKAEGNANGAPDPIPISELDILTLQRLYSEEKARRQQLQTMVSDLGDGLVLFDAEFRYVYANAYTLALMGRTEDQVRGQCFFTLFPDADATPFGVGLRKAMRDKHKVEADTFRSHSGRWWRSFIYPTEEGLIVYYRDITPLKTAEAEHSRLASIVTSSEDAILSQTLDGIITSWNAAAERIFGYAASEIIGKPMRLVFSPDRSNQEETLLERVRRGEHIDPFETVCIRKDGARIDVSLILSMLRDNDGTFIGFSTIARDISQQKRQAREREYVMASANCLLWYADVYDTGHPDYLGWDNHITDEEAAQRFLPLDLQEGEAFKDAKYRHRLPEDREACDRLGTTSIRAGKSYTQEFRCRCADDTIRWLREDIQVETVEPNKHWRVVAVCVDITDQKRLEQQYLQAQKMEGIGRLAGGIAHDFNNLLSVILGYAEMVEMELAEDSALLPNVQNIQSAATRAAKLTSQLLAFARKQVSEAKVLNLNSLIGDIGPILKPLLREDIELVPMLNEETGNIQADPHQIEQVIVNLVVNARDAMPNGGKLLVQTSNVALTDYYLREQTSVKPGEYVLLAISDTGTGMTAEVKSRLFEPFFTTKELGKGTGLGLATVYGIVKQSGGYIFVYSEVGMGTTIKVYLPRVDAPPSAATRNADKLASVRGSETVLVVEDERLVRDLTVSTLRTHGYGVIEAGNGVEALRVVEQFAGDIHLAVTDAIMPVMGGKEMADRLRELRPLVRILYVSGYPEEVTSVQGILPEGTAFLQKPFTAMALLTKVRQVLDAATAPGEENEAARPV